MDIKEYSKTLEERKKKTRVTRNFQLIGLLISQILTDEKHKSLYIKLAQKIDNQLLMGIAKDVADRRIDRPGAYFMKVLKGKGLLPKATGERVKVIKVKVE